MPDTFKIEGSTFENSVAAENLVIVYKADRFQPEQMGEELGRATADVDGNFKVTFDDWPYDVAVVAMDPTDSTLYQAKVIDWVTPILDDYDPYYENVVALLRMEGSDGANSFVDEIGNLTSVAFGLVTTSIDQVKFGTTAAKFDKTDPDTRLESSHNGELNFYAQEFCIEMFVYFNTLSGVQLILTDRDENSLNDYNYFIYAENSTFKCYFQSDVDGPLHDSNVGTFTQDTWHHIAMTRENNVVRTFLDGVEGASFSLTNYSSAVDPGTPLIFGHDTDTTGREMDGYIDSFRATIGTPRYTENFQPPVTDYPLDVDPYAYNVQVLMHMDGADQGTVFTDVKGNVVTRVGTGITSTTQAKFGSTSYYNDSASSRLSIANNPDFSIGSGDFTIEAWVYQNGDSWLKIVADKRVNTASYGEYIFRVNSNEGIDLYINNNNSWVLCQSGNFLVPNNTWSHIAFSRKGSIIRGFIDGVKVAEISTTVSATPDSNDILMGSSGSNSERLIGYIDEFRLTVGSARYVSNFTPKNAPFQDS